VGGNQGKSETDSVISADRPIRALTGMRGKVSFPLRWCCAAVFICSMIVTGWVASILEFYFMIGCCCANPKAPAANRLVLVEIRARHPESCGGYPSYDDKLARLAEHSGSASQRPGLDIGGDSGPKMAHYKPNPQRGNSVLPTWWRFSHWAGSDARRLQSSSDQNRLNDILYGRSRKKRVRRPVLYVNRPSGGN